VADSGTPVVADGMRVCGPLFTPVLASLARPIRPTREGGKCAAR